MATTNSPRFARKRYQKNSPALRAKEAYKKNSPRFARKRYGNKKFSALRAKEVYKKNPFALRAKEVSQKLLFVLSAKERGTSKCFLRACFACLASYRICSVIQIPWWSLIWWASILLLSTFILYKQCLHLRGSYLGSIYLGLDARFGLRSARGLASLFWKKSKVGLSRKKNWWSLIWWASILLASTFILYKQCLHLKGSYLGFIYLGLVARFGLRLARGLALLFRKKNTVGPLRKKNHGSTKKSQKKHWRFFCICFHVRVTPPIEVSPKEVRHAFMYTRAFCKHWWTF